MYDEQKLQDEQLLESAPSSTGQQGQSSSTSVADAEAVMVVCSSADGNSPAQAGTARTSITSTCSNAITLRGRRRQRRLMRRSAASMRR